ncbi:MAG: hypothetical protein Q9213_007376 [Squamulea squamosa]
MASDVKSDSCRQNAAKQYGLVWAVPRGLVDTCGVKREDAANTVNDHYRRIGAGNCGSVWAAPLGSEDTCAIKREDGSRYRSLYNDYVMHREVFHTLLANYSRVSVPRCHLYVSSDDKAWWKDRIRRFPDGHKHCNALITDRIPPFREAVRNILISKYCPDGLKPAIISSEANQDCLIRLYLGRIRRLERGSRFHGFSLRNYPLHLDQIEELALDFNLYARILAETLAHLYWIAHVDARDVEFVLAPPWKGDIVQYEGVCANPAVIDSIFLGDHVVWILDFDCCGDIAMEKAGVEQAVRAFYLNDPYFPRPGRKTLMEQMLWTEFKTHFLEVSEAILGRESPEASLPAMWVNLIEQEGHDREYHRRL